MRHRPFFNNHARTLTISASVASPDIHALAKNIGWDGVSGLIVNLECPYVNTLRLDGTGGKTFPGGLLLNIAANCTVGGVYNSGAAIYTRVPMTINNLGKIAGGGGSGGYGTRMYYQVSSGSSRVIAAAGAGGNGGGFASASSLTLLNPTNGSAGEYLEYTVGSVGDTNTWIRGGTGGAGGALGAGGSNGLGGTYSKGTNTYAAGFQDEFAPSGTAAGNSVNGNSYVTWQSTGTRQGALT